MIWNPYSIYTWTRLQLATWYDKHGSSAFYDGKLWKPTTTKLSAGMYEVKFMEVK